jgi:hypothetical protein
VPPRTRSRSRTAAALSLGLAAALVAGGCGPGAGSSGPASSGAAGSGTAACPTAPNPPDDLAGWGTPNEAPTIIPVLINSLVVCGQNRVLFTLEDSGGRPIGAPDRTASIGLFDLGRDPSNAIARVDGTFVWAIQDVVGIYVATVAIPEAGRYGAEVTTAASGATPVTLRLTFDVQPSSAVIKVGDHAPASRTPILADVGGDASHISTDTDPDPAFYKTSVDQALAKQEPFALVFATPKFCKSAQCGPTLDRIKPFVAKYPSVTFINVEPYKLKLIDGTLEADLDANGELQTAPTTDEWHLLSEPTVYVVDRNGIVTANFELIFSDAELTAALDAVK